MLSYLVGRVLQTLLSMLVVISIVFVLTRLSGNPVHLLLDVNATQRDFDLLTRHLGLDKPLPVQYGLYVKNIVQGDFGRSVLSRRPVTEHIWERLPATVELGVVAMLLSILIGVPIGVYSAVRRGGILDGAARVFAVHDDSTFRVYCEQRICIVRAIQTDNDFQNHDVTAYRVEPLRRFERDNQVSAAERLAIRSLILPRGRIQDVSVSFRVEVRAPEKAQCGGLQCSLLALRDMTLSAIVQFERGEVPALGNSRAGQSGDDQGNKCFHGADLGAAA